MNSLLQSSLASFQQDLLIKCEVFTTVRDLVETVESHALTSQLALTESRLNSSLTLNNTLVGRIKLIERHYANTKQELIHIRREAKGVRERFVSDIGYFLTENQLNQKLKEKIIELEDTITKLPAAVPTQSNEKNGKDNDSNNSNASKENTTVTTVPSKPKENPVIKLLTLPESVLLHMFPFLHTPEVLSYAQVCKFVYFRICTIFGIDSVVVQPHWQNLPAIYPFPQDLHGVALLLGKDPSSIEIKAETKSSSAASAAVNTNPTTNTPTSTNTAQSSSIFQITSSNPNSSNNASANAHPNEPRLTRELVDSLTKRLTAQEMKVIVGLADRLKKTMQIQDSLEIEKEDLQSRLQNTESIRDFLIEKLKSAEMAIKAMMQEINTIKKQSLSDQEIITYLDLHSQEADSQLQEMSYRCGQLQTTLDIQLHTLSLKEEQLSQELYETKIKYDNMDQQFKSQKKVMVKEIKSLRLQVEKLVDEKQTTQRRMKLLQEAFSS